MLSTASTAPSFGIPCRIVNLRPAAFASRLAWKMSFEYPWTSQTLPTVSSLMYDDALNAAQYGFAFLMTAAASSQCFGSTSLAE